MGRMYDKRDLAWNLEYWAKQEQMLHSEIANGHLPGNFLDGIITEHGDRWHANHPGQPCCRECGCRTYRWRERYDLERKRERMKLLRTGQLLSDLSVAERNFNKCNRCHYERQRRSNREVARECPVHAPAFKRAKSAVFWAGKRNQEERQHRGQERPDDSIKTVIPTEVTDADQELLKEMGIAEMSSPSDEPRNPLNHWESMYQRDKANGQWLPDDARLYETTHDYKGWLEMLLENEEITQEEYSSELARLKQVQREAEENAPQWAGADRLPNGLRKQGERFQRDNRYNRLGSGYTNLGQQ